MIREAGYKKFKENTMIGDSNEKKLEELKGRIDKALEDEFKFILKKNLSLEE